MRSVEKSFCKVGKNLHVIQSELKLAFKIWSKTPLEMIEKQFLVYMNDNFKDTRIVLDNQRRHVFKGLELNPLVYKKSEFNFDFEQFIQNFSNIYIQKLKNWNVIYIIKKF